MLIYTEYSPVLIDRAFLERSERGARLVTHVRGRAWLASILSRAQTVLRQVVAAAGRARPRGVEEGRHAQLAAVAGHEPNGMSVATTGRFTAIIDTFQLGKGILLKRSSWVHSPA